MARSGRMQVPSAPCARRLRLLIAWTWFAIAAARFAPTDPVAAAAESNGPQATERTSEMDAPGQELDRLERQLAKMVAEEPTVWYFQELQDRAAKIVADSELTADRKRARALLGKIDRFTAIRAKNKQVSAELVDRPPKMREEVGPAPDFVTTTIEEIPPSTTSEELARPVSPLDEALNLEGDAAPVWSSSSNSCASQPCAICGRRSRPGHGFWNCDWLCFWRQGHCNQPGNGFPSQGWTTGVPTGPAASVISDGSSFPGALNTVPDGPSSTPEMGRADQPSRIADDIRSGDSNAFSDMQPGQAGGGPATGSGSGAGADNQYASNIGATPNAQSAAPNMIGDFFGPGAATSTVQYLGPEQQINSLDYTTGGYFINGSLVATDRVAFFKSISGDAAFISNTIPPSINAGDVIQLANTQPYTNAAGDPLPAGQAPLQIVNGTATIQPSLLANVDFRQAFTTVITLPSPSAGGGVGFFKIAENTSPIPRDRVFFDYDYFHNVPLTSSGIGVNRYAPGVEKTFLSGLGSVEVRVPMATTINSTIVADGPSDNSHYQFGDLALAVKGLLIRNSVFALSTGLGLQLPTASDVRVVQSDGLELVRVENQTVHLQPFFGALYTPNNRFFSQGFLQIDTPAGSNPVLINPDGSGLTQAGRLTDPTYLYAGLGIGSWFFQSNQPRAVTGLAWITELHYNRSLTSSNSIQSGNFVIGTAGQTFEVLNATVGATVRLMQRSMLTAAYVTPLTGGAGRQFDGQLRVFVNYFFGRQNRLTRTPIF